jgi:predicted hotdog family 3-hydroxylacyl-ACP dehydratase
MEKVIPAPKQLLTHRPPMLLLDAIQELNSRHCRAVKVVDPDEWYTLPDGSMPGWFGIELMAQTIAAWSGYEKYSDGGQPRPGYLLGTRRYKSRTSSFPPGTMLEIEVKQEFMDSSGLGAYDCEIIVDGLVVASAIVKVYEAPMEQEK